MTRWATGALLAALTVASPAAAQQGEDRLLPPPGRCAGEANVEAHHRTQRLALHCLVRGIRRRAGVGTLRTSASLRHSATYKARRIADCRRLTHNPCGDSLAVPFHEAHLTRGGAWYVGENLAWRPFGEATAREVVRGWLASRPHRAVLLDRRFTHLGVRRRRLALDGKPRGAVIWVAHLGTPKRGR